MVQGGGNTSYEDNFTFLRKQQQSAENRERMRASPASTILNHHASATSLSSEESAFLVPRPKPATPKEPLQAKSARSSTDTSQHIKRCVSF